MRHRSKLQTSFLKTMREQHLTMNQDLYASFLSELVRRNRQSVTRTCGKGGVEVDLEASINFCCVCDKQSSDEFCSSFSTIGCDWCFEMGFSDC